MEAALNATLTNVIAAADPVVNSTTGAARSISTASSTTTAKESTSLPLLGDNVNLTLNLGTTSAPHVIWTLGGRLEGWWMYAFWSCVIVLILLLVLCAFSYCMQLQEERDELAVNLQHSREALSRERTANEQLRWHQRFFSQRSSHPVQVAPVNSAIVITMAHDEEMTRSRLSGEPITVTAVTSGTSTKNPTGARFVRLQGEELPAKPILRKPAESFTAADHYNAAQAPVHAQRQPQRPAEQMRRPLGFPTAQLQGTHHPNVTFEPHTSQQPSSYTQF
ncbi:hypothetical protein L596_022619 [Steinernema carpocapsae]|uniref:Uncharacterized protein n=1 Tax=Steinernema carpocapsae TaxID=34508 RepID=A0A4U5MM83_STECR|nr:hypothetical protein L596_022619 [Steinernema carpocapsae]